MKNTEKKGRFLVFEGIDGSGKSTQIAKIKSRILENNGICFQTCEPSGGPIGSLLRQYLSGRIKADEQTLAALFAADRLDHLLNETDGICNQLKKGIHVLCDRYFLSNYAYQGATTSLDWVMQLNEAARKTIKPDCHIFIDVEPDIALDRVAAGRAHRDLYETKEHLSKVRDTYLSLIDRLKEEECILVIDGNQPENRVFEDIWKGISQLF